MYLHFKHFQILSFFFSKLFFKITAELPSSNIAEVGLSYTFVDVLQLSTFILFWSYDHYSINRPIPYLTISFAPTFHMKFCLKICLVTIWATIVPIVVRFSIPLHDIFLYFFMSFFIFLYLDIYIFL